MDDQRLIEEALKHCRPYSITSGLPYVLPAIDIELDFFKNLLNGRRLIDIGSGENLEYTARLAGYETSTGPGLDLGIPEIILVDPFVTKERYKELGIENFPNLKSEQCEGLGYLLSQPARSASILTCALDKNVLPLREYCERLADEIHRVGQVYLSLASPYLEMLAKRRFPPVQEFHVPLVFQH